MYVHVQLLLCHVSMWVAVGPHAIAVALRRKKGAQEGWLAPLQHHVNLVACAITTLKCGVMCAVWCVLCPQGSTPRLTSSSKAASSDTTCLAAGGGGLCEGQTVEVWPVAGVLLRAIHYNGAESVRSASDLLKGWVLAAGAKAMATVP